MSGNLTVIPKSMLTLMHVTNGFNVGDVLHAFDDVRVTLTAMLLQLLVLSGLIVDGIRFEDLMTSLEAFERRSRLYRLHFQGCLSNKPADTAKCVHRCSIHRRQLAA